MKKTLLAAGAVTVLLLTGACGGGDDRPDSAELSERLQEEGGDEITKKQADCVADLLAESKLSDEGLSAAAAGEEDFEPSKKDTEELTKVLTRAGEDCDLG